MPRESGILLPVSSLPSPYGIGTLGQAAYDFVDFLAASGQRCWQVLPLTPTLASGSPYQSGSVFAGNPYLIDLDFLRQDGLLERDDLEGSWGQRLDQVDYKLLGERRLKLLRYALDNYIPGSRFERFAKENAAWLEDYALFMALQQRYGSPWQLWPAPLRQRRASALEKAKKTLREELRFYELLQYAFWVQWSHLRRYANRRGIQLIGDLPIYTALDSADVWAHQELFQLDSRGYPSAVAGVPPDAFSDSGQLWGNPLYDWKRLRRQGYDWWLQRLEHNSRLFDRLRLDHFRGFESYWAVPYGAATAAAGHWEKGPGLSFFRQIERKLGNFALIAEDLGDITPAVRRLQQQSGLPGMKVLQFAFDPENESSYLPHNCAGNCVVYTGTHDNNTPRGWFEDLGDKERDFVCRYLSCSEEDISWALLRAAWASPAPLALCQAQDLLDLPGSARTNLPGTVGNNWQWRLLPGQLDAKLARRLRQLTQTYYRLNPNIKEVPHGKA